MIPVETKKVWVWKHWIRIRNLFVRIKKLRTTLISTVFWLLYDFLSLKNNVNVSLKRNEHNPDTARKNRTLPVIMYPVEGDVDVWNLVQQYGPEPGPVLLLALCHYASQLGHSAQGESLIPFTAGLFSWSVTNSKRVIRKSLLHFKIAMKKVSCHGLMRPVHSYFIKTRPSRPGFDHIQNNHN